MGAVGGVAILGGNFEAATFPEDKVVQRSLTAGTLESSPIDAIILDALPLGAPGQLDSHAFIWKAHSNDGSPHTIDWKAFVNITADDGTGSLWTLQTRIDGAPYTDILTIDDNGLLTVSGATLTMDQLIIDTDNTEAVLIRKDGDAGDVFIVDTVNDLVRLGSDTTLLTFGGSSDVILERVSARVLQMNSDPGGANGNELRIVARDDVSARWLQLFADGTNQARVGAQRGGGGGRFDLELFTSSGSIEIWTDGVQRWFFGAGSGGFDFELAPFITNRYDIGTTLLAVRDVFTNRVFIGQDQVAFYDAVTIGATDLTGDGQQDSGAIILTAKGFETATPHDTDWRLFADAEEDDGTRSQFVFQAQIDGGGFGDILRIGHEVGSESPNVPPTSPDSNIVFIGNSSVASELHLIGTSITGYMKVFGFNVHIGTNDTASVNLLTNATVQFSVGNDLTRNFNDLQVTADNLGAPGQQDSHFFILTGQSHDGSPHTIDWQQFVDVTANDGTGSIFTIQARIDGASFVDEFTILATTSPTLVSIGPGSTGGALAFGPSASAAQAGTVRFQFTDDIRYRNEGDDGDFIALSFGESSKMILGEAGIPFIEVPAQFIVNNEMSINVDDTTALAVRSTTRTIFAVDTVNNDVELVQNVERLDSVVDRFKILGRDIVGNGNSSVVFSGAMLLEGQAREAGGALHDAKWRMYVEPLITTGFDGQSVFKITAEIDTGGPTTVFTLSDTGDLIVPGSFTIDGLIIDVDSAEAFLVRKNGDGGDVFNVDTVNSLIQVIGSAVLEIGTTPALSGSIRLPNSGSVVFRNAGDDGDLAVLSFDDSNTLDIGPQGGGILAIRLFSDEQIQLLGQTLVQVSSDTAFRVRAGTDPPIFAVDTDNGGFVTIDNADVVITNGNLRFGSIPAATGTIRLSNADSILARNLSDDGDLNIFDFGDSNEADFGDAQMPIIRILASRLESNRLRITQTSTVALEVNNDGNASDLIVDTSNNIVQVRNALTVGMGSAPVTGSIRLPNSSDIVWRNNSDDATIVVFSFGSSDIFDIGDASAPTALTQIRLHSPEVSIPAGRFEIRGSSASAFRVLDGSSVLKFNVDTTNSLVKVVGSAALTIGATPALSGSIRLSNASSITMRNANNNGDLNILSSPESNLLSFGDSSMPRIDMLASRFQSNRIRIVDSNTQAFTVETDGSLNMFRVNTIENEVIVGEAIPLQVATSVDRFIITGNNASGNSVALESHTFLMQGRTQTSGAVPHTSDWRMVVKPFSTTAFDGQSQLSFIGGIDGASLIEVLKVTNEGRFAITRPEQVSIGSPTFLDNVQVNITGAFIDDYGGGPTDTFKFQIQGSQTADAGRTSKQIIFVAGLNASIITQGATQNIQEVGTGMFRGDIISLGAGDTISQTFTLKVDRASTVGTENYGLIVDGSGTPDAFVRIGKSANAGLKLMVGGFFPVANLLDNVMVRFTSQYNSGGASDFSAILHIDAILQAAPGETSHIAGAVFDAILKTQAATESIANISQVQIDEPDILNNLGGGGLITNAQSLLITGAPTEGVSNYAFRILGGDLQIANSAAFLFRDTGDSIDLTALSLAESNILEIGGVGSGDFESVNIYSLGTINLRPTDDVQVLTDNGTAFSVRTAGGLSLFIVGQNTTRVVADNGLIIVASITNNSAETQIQSTFADVMTTSGSSVTAVGLIPAGSLVFGVTVKVLNAVSGPSGFDVGDGIDVDRWGNSISGGSLTTTDITDFTSGAVTTFQAANDVVLTSDGVDFTAGEIRITIHYLTIKTST